MRWAETPTDLVLTGGGVVSEDEPGSFIPREDFVTNTGPARRDLPYAVVQAGPVRMSGRRQPGMGEVRLRIWVVAGARGITSPPSADNATFDSHGVNQVKGVNRDASQGQGKSTGREVDEVCARLIEALNGGQLIDSTHACQANLEIAGVLPVSGVQVLARAIDVVVFNGTTSKFYHPARAFTATKVGAQASLAWTAPPQRYDSTLGLIKRGTNAGDPAPTSPTSGGVVVANPASSATSATDTPPGGGTWNYAIWMGYAETPAGQLAQTPDRYSERLTAGVAI